MYMNCYLAGRFSTAECWQTYMECYFIHGGLLSFSALYTDCYLCRRGFFCFQRLRYALKKSAFFVGFWRLPRWFLVLVSRTSPFAMVFCIQAVTLLFRLILLLTVFFVCYNILFIFARRANAALAQLVEHVICNLGVVGPSPTGSFGEIA